MRRETFWTAQIPTQDVIASADTANFIGSGGTDITLNRPLTIVRTRGVLQVGSDQNSATEDQEIGFGMVVVSDQAIAIGVTAIPTPMVDINSDLWFVYELIFSNYDVISAIGTRAADGATRFIQFDSKAMRKVEDGTNLAVVAETSPTSEGVSIVSGFRMLLKLH